MRHTHMLWLPVLWIAISATVAAAEEKKAAGSRQEQETHKEGPQPPDVSEKDQVESRKLYGEGLAIEKSKDLDGAIAKWKAALKLDPRNAYCLNHYAWFLGISAPEERRDLDRALKFARRAADVTKWENHDILDTLAEVYYCRKEHAKAVEVQQKALDAKPIGRGKTRYLKKQLEKFEKALKASEEESQTGP